jgi:feruloyl esterase
MRRFRAPLLFCLLPILFATAGMGQSAPPGSCAELGKLALPQAAITSARLTPAGAFLPPAAPGAASPRGDFKSLPAFYRVEATLKPADDSDIRIEVWLPASGWNGKYQAVGNGGWSSAIGYAEPARALA